jgi:phage gpG-like protein
MKYAIVDVNNSIDKLQAKFETMGLASADFSEPFAKIVTDIYRIEESIFNSRGRRGGGSWKKLSPVTVRIKGHDTILEDTGDLRDSLTQPNHRYQVLDIQNEHFIFGTSRPYAYVQQRGGSPSMIPPRSFIRFMDEDLARWNRILLEHLTEAFN